jgi:hypothetical protein
MEARDGQQRAVFSKALSKVSQSVLEDKYGILAMDSIV